MKRTGSCWGTLSVAVLLLSAAVASVVAQPTQMKQALPDGPATIVSGDVEFKVPRRFLVNSYVAEQATPHIARNFQVAFWLSDGSAPVDMPLGMFLLDFWPPEKGRPASGSADFLVNLFVTQQPARLDSNWARPSQMVTITLSNGRWLGEEKKYSAYGLECHEFTPRDYPVETYFKMCHSPAGTMPEAYLVTNWNEGKPEAPYWRMDVWSESDGLWFNVFFPEQALDRWRDVVDASLILVRSWRVTR